MVRVKRKSSEVNMSSIDRRWNQKLGILGAEY